MITTMTLTIKLIVVGSLIVFIHLYFLLFIKHLLKQKNKMGNNDLLKNSIAAIIKANGINAITGQVLQDSLLSLINSIGRYYKFVDVAIPTTSPGNPDDNVFYFASSPGTYSNFSNITVDVGEVAIFVNTTSIWVKKTLVSGLSKADLFNVTENVPLSSGYYTKSTAISAVPITARKKGLIITAEHSSGNWGSYQFTGTISQWNDSSKWINYAGKSITDLIDGINSQIETITDMIVNINDDISEVKGLLEIFNVTESVPLSTGYYVKSTAIAAVPEQYRKRGLIITFQYASGTWGSYQFVSTMNNWLNIGYWFDYAGQTIVDMISTLGNQVDNIDERLSTIETSTGAAIFNISTHYNRFDFTTREQARATLDTDFRKVGLVITYYIVNEGWIVEIYNYTSTNLWNSYNNTNNPFQDISGNVGGFARGVQTCPVFCDNSISDGVTGTGIEVNKVGSNWNITINGAFYNSVPRLMVFEKKTGILWDCSEFRTKITTNLVYNISYAMNNYNYTNDLSARNDVVLVQRQFGGIYIFRLASGVWKTKMFASNVMYDWTDNSKWVDILMDDKPNIPKLNLNVIRCKKIGEANIADYILKFRLECAASDYLMSLNPKVVLLRQGNRNQRTEPDDEGRTGNGKKGWMRTYVQGAHQKANDGYSYVTKTTYLAYEIDLEYNGTYEQFFNPSGSDAFGAKNLVSDFLIKRVHPGDGTGVFYFGNKSKDQIFTNTLNTVGYEKYPRNKSRVKFGLAIVVDNPNFTKQTNIANNPSIYEYYGEKRHIIGDVSEFYMNAHIDEDGNLIYSYSIK